MTRKDFELIAELIQDIRETGVVTDSQAEEIASIAAENLRHTNPLFDRDRFFEAATGDTS